MRQILLPASAGFVLTGMRISLAIALIVTVIAEMVAGNSGIGFEAARLDIVNLALLNERSRNLVSVEGATASAEQISGIVDVLSSRLGPKRVVRPQLHDEHAPERAAVLRAGWEVADDGMEVSL